MTTMDETNAPLRAAVAERLASTPADDPKMVGYKPSTNAYTLADFGSPPPPSCCDGGKCKPKTETYADWRPPAYAEPVVVGEDVLSEWAEFTRDEPRQTGDGVPGERPTVAEQTLQSALEAVRDRHGKYGPPAQHFARTASLVNAAFGTTFTGADWALVMVLDKVARLRGPTPTTDGGVDIAGYGGCYEECRTRG